MPSSGPVVHHPIFARAYARLAPKGEAHGIADHRRMLLQDLTGRVLEIGAGSGLNFPHYPPAVTVVVALEPEPHLRRLAIGAAESAPVRIDVIDAVGEAIPAADGSFEYAVAALVLCSVGDPELVLAETYRVLKPGGGLRYYEHVIAESRTGALAQRVMDATVWPRLVGGCHLARDTGSLIRSAGFTVTAEQRLAVKTSTLQPAIPHLLGAATRA